MFKAILTVGAFAALQFTIFADWANYRGPTHNGVAKESISLTSWTPATIRQLWKVPTSQGFSSFSIGNGKAYTLVLRNVGGAEMEFCVALDANTGKEVWAQQIGTVKTGNGGQDGTADNKGGDGPRSTPAVSGDKVYTLSAKLVLTCFNANNGQAVWKKDLLREHNGKNINWENAASPVIDGELIFVGGGGPGQALLGINKNDGKVVWKTQDDLITHATPALATILGERQVIFFTQKGLVALAPKDGAVLWRYDFPFGTSTAMTPVVGGDIVFCSAGYHHTAGAVKITKTGGKFAATELYKLKGKGNINHWSSPVYKDGYMYGMFSFKQYGDGPLKCMDIKTGKIMWEKEGFGPGNVILAGHKLIVLGDAGQVALVHATPGAYKEIGRIQAVSGKCWSTPALSNGRLYVRSTKEGACFDVTSRVSSR